MEMEAFRVSLERAAARESVSVAGVKWEFATLEATWGDLCGYVFYGAEPAVCERVAEFFAKWMAKHGPKSCYEAQRHVRVHGKMHYSEFSNGARSWSRSPYEGPEVKRYEGVVTGEPFEVRLVEKREGVAVATVYYPCAD